MKKELSFLKYLIPAVLTLAVGIILWQIQKERLEISYELVESEAFPREGGIGKYFIIKLENTGNRPVESIQYQVLLSKGIVQFVKFSTPQIVNNQRLDSCSMVCMIPLLNPGEILTTTITSIGQEDISTPRILARARGTTAIPKSHSEFPYSSMLIVALAMVTVITTIFSWYTQYRANNLVATSENLRAISQSIEARTEQIGSSFSGMDKGKPGREHKIFALLNTSGLSYLVPQLIASGDDFSYWRTGLVILHSFLSDKGDSDKYINAMKSLINLPMSKSSLSFNLYLLSRMEKYIGHTEESNIHLEQCKTKAPSMYELLLRQDQSYDLNKLADWISRHPLL